MKHPLYPELADRELRRDRDIIKQAEPHRLTRQRMMPRGAHRTERSLRGAGDEFADHRARTTGRVQCRLIGRLTNERVGVELTAATQRQPTNEPDMHRRMHQFDLCARGRGRLHPDASRPTGRLQRGLDRLDPPWAVGMVRELHPRVVLERRRVMEIQHH